MVTDLPDLRNASVWGNLLRETTRVLAASGVPTSHRVASMLLGDILDCSFAQLLAYPNRQATCTQIETLQKLLVRCMAREPVQYVLGHTDFCGLQLRVTPDVLIPRPETEQVTETVLEILREGTARRVLDIGTGSGCIALGIKHALPEMEVVAIDISKAALSVAQSNAHDHDLAVTFIHADVLATDFSHHIKGPFDLLVTNPPYLADSEACTLQPEVRAYEPALALFAGRDPLRYYRAIISHAPSILTTAGWCVFEAHAYHAEAVGDLLKDASFCDVTVRPDLAGHPRIVIAACGTDKGSSNDC